MKRLLQLLLTAVLGALAGARAETLTIAAAANLAHAMEELRRDYTQQHPEVEVVLVTGASGNLMAQIQRGAPYDLFLSADLEYPRQLVASGRADGATLQPFAVGRLVLWTTRPRERLRLEEVSVTLRDPQVRRIAIANPDHAPYGQAARAALQALALWSPVAPKLVVGESVAQAAQFTETGAADVGLVAYSLVMAPAMRHRGRWLEIPTHLHPPLTQGAVITQRGTTNPAAHAFLAYLRSPAAGAVLERWGYGGVTP